MMIKIIRLLYGVMFKMYSINKNKKFKFQSAYDEIEERNRSFFIYDDNDLKAFNEIVRI